jgi:hypothetical protein
MPDREKVIKGLQTIIDDDWMCKHADYYASIISDALALLKEQEAVKPIFDEVDVCGRCGNCGHALTQQKKIGDNVLIDERYDYCPSCGRAVKWE